MSAKKISYISKGLELSDTELENIVGGRSKRTVDTEYRCPNCQNVELFIGEQPDGRTCWICGGQGINVVMSRNVIRG